MSEEKGIKVPDALIYSTSLEDGSAGQGSNRQPVGHLPGLGLTADGDGSARGAEEGGATAAVSVNTIPGLGIGSNSTTGGVVARQPRRENDVVRQHRESIEAERRAEEEEEHAGPKLGLGDFIFYSVLMALTAQKDDWGW